MSTSNRVVITSRRIVVSPASARVPCMCRRHREGAIAECWAARWRHDQRRCWSRLETAIDELRLLKCRNTAEYGIRTVMVGIVRGRGLNPLTPTPVHVYRRSFLSENRSLGTVGILHVVIGLVGIMLIGIAPVGIGTASRCSLTAYCSATVLLAFKIRLCKYFHVRFIVRNLF